MKHRRAGRKLNRSLNQRKALFKNLVSALIIKGSIQTTEAKAKAVKRLVEKLISRARTGTLQARRMMEAFLQNKQVVNKLVDEVGPRFRARPGGYTTWARVARRRGDNAVVVNLALVDQEEAVKAATKKAIATKKPGSKSKPQTQGLSLVKKTKVPLKVTVGRRQEAAQIQKRGLSK